MIHNKYHTILASAISISLLLTCISAQAGDSQNKENLKNSSMNNTDQSTQTNDSEAKVELGMGDYISTQDISAKSLLNIDTVDKNGDLLGKIKDLLLNDKDEITYAVIAVGGVLGVGEDASDDKLVAVPFNKQRKNDLTRKEIILSLTKQQLKQAPAFKFEKTKANGDQINNHSTTSNAGNKYGATNINYESTAKEIIGRKVVGKDNNLLGKIKDLILNNDDKIVYAIMSVGGVLGTGDTGISGNGGKLVAVPFPSLRMNKTEDQYTLNVTEQQLEQAPGFQFRRPRM